MKTKIPFNFETPTIGRMAECWSMSIAESLDFEWGNASEVWNYTKEKNQGG